MIFSTENLQLQTQSLTRIIFITKIIDYIPNYFTQLYFKELFDEKINSRIFFIIDYVMYFVIQDQFL